MRKLELAYKDTGYFYKFVLDYLEEKEALKPFYKYPVSLEAFEQVIDDKTKDRINRDLLVEVLESQNEEHASNYSLVKENIKLLAKKNTFTITTGHQLCIAGGPLYFIYKVISVLKLCKTLEKEYPDNNFVPVFWLASEDHGEGEISKINLFGKSFEWEHSEKGASGKRGAFPYSKIDSELRELFKEDDQAQEILNIFTESYSGAKDLTHATRSYLYKLFGEYGLVVIDGDDIKLKGEFASIMKEELLNSSTKQKVSETIARYGENYKIQANVREINLFYLGNNFRERIVKEGTDYKVLNTEYHFSEADILKEIDSHPERFSPNVLTRPLYEEKILPNLAYVGGPGESAYWMQLKSIFEYHNINYPMIILRDSVQWIDMVSQQKLMKIGVDIQEIFQSIDKLEQQYIKKNATSFSSDKYLKQLNVLFDGLSQDISKVDQSLLRTVKGEKVRFEQGLENVVGKTNKAIKRKHEVELNQLRKLKEKLFPNDGLQERYDNIIPLYSRYGKDLIQLLIDNLNVLNKKFTVILED